MNLFTEAHIRELRRRLGIGVSGGRLAQSFGTHSHTHDTSDVPGVAVLDEPNVFTDAVNTFEQIHANVGIATDGAVTIEEGTIDATLLTGVQTYQLPDQSGTLALTSDIGVVPDGDYGDVSIASGVWTVDNYTHNHAGVYEPADSTILKDADIGVTVHAQPTGTPDGTKYLRDDNSWQAVSGGSGLTQPQVMARCMGC